MRKNIALLITLDTKAQEASYLKAQIEAKGHNPILIDIGVIGKAGIEATYSRKQVIESGGGDLDELLKNPTREKANPFVVKGSIHLLKQDIIEDKIHAVIGLGGTQGTSTCCEIMRSMPYGFPKIMVSTIASGDTSGFVGIKDITMMFSVSDILKLNRFTRKILANAASAACGMAEDDTKFLMEKGDKPLIGMTNLGVLTQGTIKAVEYFESKGYEVIVFHAVGSGGRAMEQMMKEGIIGAVFDYAMGEIADDVWSVLRAGGPERLTIAGKLGLPQVLCPGGAEHLGILVPANEVPQEFKNHKYVFHSPVVFVPRLNEKEIIKVAEDICQRLQYTSDKAYFMIPKGGVGSYSKIGGVLHDPSSDKAFFDYFKQNLPSNIEIIERENYVEDTAFVLEAVDLLISLIEDRMERL